MGARKCHLRISIAATSFFPCHILLLWDLWILYIYHSFYKSCLLSFHHYGPSTRSDEPSFLFACVITISLHFEPLLPPPTSSGIIYIMPPSSLFHFISTLYLRFLFRFLVRRRFFSGDGIPLLSFPLLPALLRILPAATLLLLLLFLPVKVPLAGPP